MDEVDIMLCGMLIANSRTPYRELADELGISLQAVYRRIQVMQENGVIGGFITNIASWYLDAVIVYVFGSSLARSMDVVVEELRKNDSTYIVLVSDRNYLSIGALLRKVSDLEGYVAFVRNAAQIADPKIGLESMTSAGGTKLNVQVGERPELSSLDYRIINALHNDSRRAVEDVAEELGVSAATVRRRLAKMMEDRVMEMTIDWRPSASGALVSQVHVQLKPGVDKLAFAGRMTKKHGTRFLFFVSYSNLPDFLLCGTWANSFKELRETVEDITKDEAVDSLFTNIVQTEFRFDTWREKVLISRASASRPKPT